MNRIKELREAAGLTVSGLADIIGAGTASVCKWENGTVVPNVYAAYKMAREFGVSIEYLMGYQEATRIKVQYEDEELTLKELVDRLRKVSFNRDQWRQIAAERNKRINELERKFADAQSVRHGRCINGAEIDGKEHAKCVDSQL